MKKLLFTIALLATSAHGMERISGWCEQGAKVVIAPAVVGGLPLNRNFQQSYPSCTVNVFITGSGGTRATVFSTNSTSTPMSNPFSASNLGYWSFYAPNGRYDVQISGGGLSAPFTFGDNTLFDINDFTPCPGCILSATGFITTGGQYSDFTSQTGGMFIRGINVSQNSSKLAGGYIKLSPITYNPADGPPQFDIYGNPIRNPVMLPGDTLGKDDAVLFVGEATSMIPNPDLVMGLFTNVYMFSRVGFATDYASEASIQSLNGGMQALSFAAVNYLNGGHHAGIPPITPLDQFHAGALYYDDSFNCERVYSGTAWSCLGGGSGGGAAGGTGQVQYNSSGSFAASGNFTWDNTNQKLSVTGIAAQPAIDVLAGYISTNGGVVSLNGSIASIQAPSGGMNARAFAAVSYMQSGNNNGTPTLVSGDMYHAGALYFDTGNNCEELFNGTVWACLGAGGGGSPGGSNTQVQFNNFGTFGGSSNFTWNNGGQQLIVTAASSSSAGISVRTGYVDSAIGFNALPATATTYNAMQALGGGMAAKSFTAINYTQTGNSNGVPSLSGGDSYHPGAMYYDTGANCEEINNGSGWSCLSTGGSTSPGGATTNVQYNAGGSFAGSGNFVWNNSVQTLTITAQSAVAAGLKVLTGYVQSDIGYVALPATATTFNAFQATGGGMTAKSFTAISYIQSGNSAGTPALTTGDNFHPGALYWDTVANSEKVYNGSAWVNLSGGGGGSPGGGNTNVQFNSSGAFAGSNNFEWDNVAQKISITSTGSTAIGMVVNNGYVVSDYGYVATPGFASTYNAFQAPTGGMAALSFTAANYVQTGQSFGVPTPTVGDSFHAGAMYYDNSTNSEKVFNGVFWVTIGGLSPGGPGNSVQFNSSGSFGGSSSLLWDDTTKILTVVTNPNTAGIAVANGYVQSTQGFVAPGAVQFNTIQAPSGGVYAASLVGLHYVQTGEYFGAAPVLTSGDSFQPGAMSWNGSVNAEYVYNGSAWVPLGSGGGGVTSAAGTANQVLVNGGASPQTGAVTLSLPQSIATTSGVTFGSVNSPIFQGSGFGPFNITFQNANALWQVDTAGNMSAAGDVNLTGGSSVYSIGGFTVINHLRQFVGQGVDVGSNGIQAGGYNIVGGFLGRTWTVNIPGGFSIAGSGCSGGCTNLVFRGGVLVDAN